MKKIELLKKIEPLFFDKTYKEISLQDIADVFGIKKASLYYYFESKDDLFLSLMEYSFSNYLKFLEESLELNLIDFVKVFIYYPSESKNFFSVLSQNGYCSNINLRFDIQKKQEIAFWFIDDKLEKKYNFSKEKTFIFMSLLEDIWRKKCLFWKCPVDINLVIKQIELLFIK